MSSQQRRTSTRQLERGLRAIVAIALLASGFGTVLGAPPTVLAAISPPALVQAQGLSDTTIELLWTPVTGATAYKVYLDGAGSALVTTTGTRYDGTVAPLSTHSYRVTAVAGSESALSAAATATSQAPRDSVAPSTPGPISATSLTSSSVKLSWGQSTDNVGIEGYRILRGPASNQLVDIDTTDAVASYSDSNLLANTTYVYGVQALDAANNVSGTRTITIKTATVSDTTAPASPGVTTTRVFSSTRIDLYWAGSSSSDLSGYQVLRDGSVVGTVALPDRMTFSDTGLSANTTYTYTIRAVDSAGNLSAPSNPRSDTTLAPGTVIVARGPYVQWVTTSSARVVWWTNLQTQAVVSCPSCPQTTSIDPTPAYEHVVLLAGLTAGTSYAYTAGDGTTTASGTFQTAAVAGTPFSFAAIGDFGGGSPGEAGNASGIATDGTSFIQTLGDNVYPEAADPSFPTEYSDYDARLFKQFGPALASKAFWAANGNKEYYGHGAWFSHMWLPNNERWYSYDWGDAHILVLDTEQPFAPGTPQYAFAEADLGAHQSSKWRIVALQRPAYSSTSANSSSAPVRADLVSLFEAQRVQLVLSGNSHNYERTYPIFSNGNPDNPVVATYGVTYVVSGNGGNGFNAFTIAPPSWSAFRQADTYGYLRVSVSPSSLGVDEISSSGTVLDSATITPATSPPPGPPLNPVAVPRDSRAVVSWNAPTPNGGAPPSAYTVLSSPGGHTCTTTGALTCTVGGLTNYSSYTFTVTASNVGGSGSPSASSAAVTPLPGVERLSGPTRFATAAAISQATFPPGVDVAYVAYAFGFPDALAGAAAAGTVRGPVLLAATSGPLDSATAAELTRLQPKRIVVLGGSGVISDSVLAGLATFTSGSVSRLAGPDRFATAAAISAATFAPGVDVAYVAYAFNFPDALAGAAAAGTLKGPVLLVAASGAINPSTAGELTRLAPKRIVVLGGSGVVSDGVMAALDAFTSGGVSRLWGSDRFATAAAISAATFAPGVDVAYVAYAFNFPDALAGAAAAGTIPGPVLLAATNLPLNPATAAELTRLRPLRIVVLGGTGVLSDAVMGTFASFLAP